MPETLVSWSAQTKKKAPEDYARDRVKYDQYFKGKIFLPILELVEAVQPKIISFIITDLKTRRLAGIQKDTFEELIKAAGIPARYFLQEELCYLGCPDAFGRPCKETGRE